MEKYGGADDNEKPIKPQRQRRWHRSAPAFSLSKPTADDVIDIDNSYHEHRLTQKMGPSPHGDSPT